MSRLRLHLQVLAQVPGALFLLVVTHLPGLPGIALRRRYWARRLRSLGRDVHIDVGVLFQGAEHISIGDHTWIDRGAMILAGVDDSAREKIERANPDYAGGPGEVRIGANCHIAPYSLLSGISGGLAIGSHCQVSAGAKVYAFSHHYASKARPGDRSVVFSSMAPHDRQCLVSGPVTIGDNVALALHAVVLPGVSIPSDCFVGIQSVVKRGPFEPNSLIAGDPAVAVGVRYAERAA